GKANLLAVDLDIAVIDWAERSHHKADLIINATPLGMAGEYMHLSPWPLAVFPARTVVFDLVYNPLQTRFLTDARLSGCTVISGLSMFLHQGLAQFELWTGKTLNPVQAESLLREELNRRQGA
ncbi:MAG: shikimate dehydrogenase, partial [Desulfovibrionaceae bacterium]